MTYDCIVIGAGLAGLVSGLRLAEAGLQVLIIAKGHGATHWAHGAVGVAHGSSPAATVTYLAGQPNHPYARAGLAALAPALNLLQAHCAAADYPFSGDLARNQYLPTALGARLPLAFVPATMAAGAVPRADAAALLIAGFQELRDFFPSLMAANLRAQGVAAQAQWLSLPTTARRHGFTPTILAELFEQPSFRQAVGRQLRAVRGTATQIAFPAVLGQSQAARVVADLSDHAGVPVFEVPTLPPSVPGMRLYTILAQAFTSAGGRIQLGSWITRVESNAGRITALYSAAAAREQRHQAATFLLATGGIAGGGFRAEQSGQLTETALGLPVVAPAHRGAWFANQFIAPQPIHTAGILTDAALRPIAANGAPLYTNLVVAGAALGGTDLIREGSYEGVALATGWYAAGTVLNDLLGVREPVDQAATFTKELL